MWVWKPLVGLDFKATLSSLNTQMLSLSQALRTAGDRKERAAIIDGVLDASGRASLVEIPAGLGAFNITAIANGAAGQEVKILTRDAAATFVHSATLRTTTGANKATAPNTVYRFVCAGGGEWVEW